jgi:hypothetical protein
MGKFLYALWFICPQIGKLQILHNALSLGVEFGACQFGGACLTCCGVQANFYRKFFVPDHQQHQSGIFYGMESLLQKKTIATKMIENS